MDKTKKLVLTIEDQPAIADLLGFLLDATELDVKRSDNGAEGLEMIKKLKPDLVIMDVMMPVMDGWQVFDAVRQNEMTQNIPIIMLSVARQEPERRMAFRGSHLDFYMTKPFDVASLRRMVQEVLGIEIWIKSVPILPTPPESFVKSTQPIQPPPPATPSPTTPSVPSTAVITPAPPNAPSLPSEPSVSPAPATPPIATTPSAPPTTSPTLPPEPSVPATPPTDVATPPVPTAPPEPPSPAVPSEPSAPPQVKE